MSVLFVFETVDQMEVSIDKEFEIGQALEILTRQNRLAKSENKRMCCDYIIINNEEIVYQSSIVFPVLEEFNLYELIETELIQDIENLEERQAFIDFFSSVLPLPKNKQKLAQPKKKKLPKSQKVKRPLSKQVKRKIVMAIGGIVVMGLMYVIGITVIFPIVSASNESTSQSVTSKDTFQTYFDKEEYEKALAVNDNLEKREQIVKALITNQSFERLAIINKQYPTKEASFELAFFYGEWQTVIDTPFDSLSKERQVMVCHAYIKLNKLEEATILNNVLKSDFLSKAIAIGYIQSGDIKKAEDVQATLNDESVNELILEATAYLKLIKRYEEEKDTDSANNWKQLLKNLGKEQQNDKSTN